MKKILHEKLDKEVDELVAKGILPSCCCLNSKTLYALVGEVPKGRRMVVPFDGKPIKPSHYTYSYGSKAGIIYFHIDNRLNYANFKLKGD